MNNKNPNQNQSPNQNQIHQHNFYQLSNIKILEPYLKFEIDKKTRNCSTSFRNIEFNNLKIKGTLFQEKDWMMCFHVSFYLYITEQAKEDFNSNYIKLYWWLNKYKLGRFKLVNDIKNKIHLIPWWEYDSDTLIIYSHERNLQTIKFCKYQIFGIDINLYPPDTYQYANNKDINIIYQEACSWISNLNCFQDDKYVKFRPTNPKKNINIIKYF